MAKEHKSKLDQFTERLDQWFGVDKKTIAEVQEQLRQDGCTVSAGRLSEWWSARSSQLTQDKMLKQIVTGSQQCKEVESLFGENPPPETETLIKLVRVLIMKFSTEANITPEMSELVFNLLKPVIKWQELAVKKEALGLERQKFQRTTVELFLKWYVDEEAKKIVTLNVPNQEKTERLGQRMFGELWQ